MSGARQYSIEHDSIASTLCSDIAHRFMYAAAEPYAQKQFEQQQFRRRFMQHLHTKARITCAAFIGSFFVFVPAVSAEADFQTTCNPEADQAFNEGLNLIHNMMYIQAEDAFNKAAAEDPTCAMAQWGIAMSNFHPLWPGTPSEAETARGSAAAEKLAAMSSESTVEQGMIDAAVAFYAPNQDGYRAQLASWAEAQIATADLHSNDIDAAAFAALARLATAPRGGDGIQVKSKVGDALDELHRKMPDHPGVIHYAIHAYDNPPLKWSSPLKVVHQLG